GPHFSTVKGYDAYAQKVALTREIGMDGIVSAFMQAAVWGTPDRILRTLEERRAIVGDFELATSFRFGGTPFDLAESGLRLYAKEVLPVVRSWAVGPAGAAPVGTQQHRARRPLRLHSALELVLRHGAGGAAPGLAAALRRRAAGGRRRPPGPGHGGGAALLGRAARALVSPRGGGRAGERRDPVRVPRGDGDRERRGDGADAVAEPDAHRAFRGAAARRAAARLAVGAARPWARG